jgi:hypothetical protein
MISCSGGVAICQPHCYSVYSVYFFLGLLIKSFSIFLIAGACCLLNNISSIEKKWAVLAISARVRFVSRGLVNLRLGQSPHKTATARVPLKL